MPDLLLWLLIWACLGYVASGEFYALALAVRPLRFGAAAVLILFIAAGPFTWAHALYSYLTERVADHG